MPQLDIGIFYVEFFLNFFYFWFIYLFLAKNIFPFLNKSIKIRKYKIKKINSYLNFYVSNFNFLNSNFKNIKTFFDFFICLNLNQLFTKLNLIFYLFIKKYNIFFLNSNQVILKKYLNKFLFLNKI